MGIGIKNQGIHYLFMTLTTKKPTHHILRRNYLNSFTAQNIHDAIIKYRT